MGDEDGNAMGEKGKGRAKVGRTKKGQHDDDLIPRDVLLERYAIDRMYRHARLAACRMFGVRWVGTDTIMLPYDAAAGDQGTLDMLEGQIDTLRMIYGLGSIDLVIGDTPDEAFSDYEEMIESLVLGLCGVGTIGTTLYTREDGETDSSDESQWVWVESGVSATQRYASCDDLVDSIERRIDECMTQLVPCEIGHDAGTAWYAEVDGQRVELPASVTRAARALCECRLVQHDVITMDRDGICDLLGGIAGRLLA